MSSDYAYISEHMGGWNDDTGLPNFMDEPGFSDDSYSDEEDEYDNEDDSNNLDVDFDIGDTVNLNSSDVLMTIKSIDDDMLTCRWFDKNNILQNEKFNALEINLVNKKQSYQAPKQQSYQQPKQQSNYIPVIDIDEDEIPF